jgi:NTE family protein
MGARRHPPSSGGTNQRRPLISGIPPEPILTHCTWASAAAPYRALVPIPAGQGVRKLLSLCVAFMSVSCSTAHYPINALLTETKSVPGYTVRNLSAPDNSDSLTLMLSLSGGGYRAAAMSYAVMEVMNETVIHWDGQDRTLLQELDFISAVSGGSLAAAYYALHRERFFEQFRPQVLNFDMQSALWAAVLSPSGFWRQTSTTFGRGDLLQEVLDDQVLHGATYADLPRRRPMVYINATDMKSGNRFEFSQDQFDLLCSDLDQVPIARAVAASMAVPVALSPVTFWNHQKHCPVTAAVRPGYGKTVASSYVHLLDGGLSDNTGVRTAIENIAARGGLLHSTRLTGFNGVRKRVFIVVNAQANPEDPGDESPATPGLLRQLRSAVDVPIDRYSEGSLQLLGEALLHWKEELRLAPDQAFRDDPISRSADFRVIEISIMGARKTALSEAVKAVPTMLRISAKDVDLIRRFVRSELAANPGWQALLRELQADSTGGRQLVLTGTSVGDAP